METYTDVNGDSGVAEYETGDDYIRVRFKNGGVYLYTYAQPGQNHVNHMITLAIAGDGLNSYINKNVRKLYEAREA